MDSSLVHSETLKHVLFFEFYSDGINKQLRLGPKGYPVFRFIASGEVIDLEGEIIELQAIEEVMPIMLKQGGRIQSFHINHPGGEFFDWGSTNYEGVDSLWVDVEVYTDYPSQRENLRRILLPKGHKERINGLSLGGFKLAKQRECNEFKCWTRITKIEGWELSLVDNPANQLADNIEDKIDDMEFVSLMKEQPRDDAGKFAKDEPVITSISTTTVTNFDNNDVKITKKVKDDCPCGKHIDKKGEYPDKEKAPKDAPPEEEAETGVEEAIEGEEELEEALDDEEGIEEGLDGTGEEEFMPEGGPEESDVAERNIAVENNEMLRTLLTALNIEKGEISIERLQELLAALNIKKEEPTMEPDNKPIEIEGKKFIKKGNDFIPYIDEGIVEIEGKKYIRKGDNFEPYVEATTKSGLGLTADEVASIVTKSLEPFATKLAKLENPTEVEEVTSNTDDPSTIQKEAPAIIPVENTFYMDDASNFSIEKRLKMVHSMSGVN